MNERLLQYIWQHQHFNAYDLTTTRGERLEILDQGEYNRNQGPDFLHARIKMAGRLWVGNIELHIDASDWYRHAHDEDANYNNVILHVVWNDDAEIALKGQPVPMLVLNSRVPRLLLEQYGRLLAKQQFIPCEKCIRRIEQIKWSAWKERLLIERLNRKTAHIRVLLEKNRRHWDETLWWMIARHFGLMINADVFEEVAMSVSLKILLRHHREVQQLEAILFGQAALLHANLSDEYAQRLYRDYLFLKEKYSFTDVHQRVQFLRMRPAAFPTIRLAQLAMLISSSPDLFSGAVDVESMDIIKEKLNLPASDYWSTHFLFDEESPHRVKHPGEQLLQSVLVNSIVPFIYLYGECRGEEKYIERALRWLREMVPEKNVVVKGFKALGIEANDAADTQALLELKSRYCNERRCLECVVGGEVLRAR